MNPVNNIPFDVIYKAVAQDTTDLRGAIVHHGTSASEIQKIVKGIKDIGSGTGGPGLYVALEHEKALAKSFAEIKGQFFKGAEEIAVMTGQIDPSRTLRVGRITLAPRNSPGDLTKGIFPATWARDNPALHRFMRQNFDILEVCGAENAGLAIPSNRFLVIHERAGSNAIRWSYADTWKPRCANPATNSTRIALSRLPPSAARNLGLFCLRNGGHLINAVILGFDIHHEYNLLPPSANRLEHAMIHGSVRFLMNALANFSHNSDALIYEYEAPIHFSTDAKWNNRSSQLRDQLIAQYGKEKIDKIIQKGLTAGCFRRLDSIAPRQDDLTIEERLIYNTYMNARIRDIQYTCGNALVEGYDLYLKTREEIRKGSWGYDKSKPSLGDRAAVVFEKAVIDLFHQVTGDLKTVSNAVQELNSFLKTVKIPQKWDKKNLKEFVGQIKTKTKEIISKAGYELKLNRMLSHSCSHSIDSSGSGESEAFGSVGNGTIQNRQLADPASFASMPALEEDSGTVINFCPALNSDLNWEYSNPDGKGIVARTTLPQSAPEIESAMQFLGQLAQPDAKITPPSSLDLPSITESSEEPEQATPFDPLEESPSFSEHLKITDLRIGAGVAGGIGVIMTLASGAELGLFAQGGAIAFELTVGLDAAFLTALGTGLVYALPAAALLIGIQQVIKNHQEKIVKHLVHDSENQRKDKCTVDAVFAGLKLLCKSFQKGEIDPQNYIRELNDRASFFQSKFDKARERGRYASHHKGSPLFYFADAIGLRQAEMDLKEMARQLQVKQEIQTTYTQTLKGKSLAELVHDLQSIGSNRLVDLPSSLRQTELVGEIAIRLQKGENHSGFETVKPLTEQPAAVYLNPANVPKPSHISAANIKGHHHDKKSSERRRDRLKKWADGVAEEHNRFRDIARGAPTGEQLKQAAARVLQKIEEAEKEGWLDYNLISLKLGKEKIENAGDYYKEYISSISSSVETTLNMGLAILSGTPLAEPPASVDKAIPPSITKPSHISAVNIKGHHHKENSSKRRRDRLKKWADEVIVEYDKFRELLKGSPTEEQLQQARSQVLQKLEEGKKEGWLDYNLVDLGFKTAEDYYANLIFTVRTNVETAFDKAPEDNVSHALFPPELLDLLAYTNRQNAVLEALKGMQDATQALQKADDREKPHSKGADQGETAPSEAQSPEMQAADNSSKPKKLTLAQRKVYFETAYQHAQKLLALELTAEDFKGFVTEGNTQGTGIETPEEIKQNVIDHAKEIVKLYTINGYEEHIPTLYSPAVRCVLHLLNDLNRYDGYERLQLPTRILNKVQLIAPWLLPSALQLPEAFIRGNGTLMGKHLVNNVKASFNEIAGLTKMAFQLPATYLRGDGKSVREQLLSKTKGIALGPIHNWRKAASASKKLGVIQGSTTTLQCSLQVVSLATEAIELLSNNASLRNFNKSLSSISGVVQSGTSLAHYTQVGVKLHKYCKLGTLAAKYHKIAVGVGGVAMTVFDLYEFMATELDLPENQASWGYSDHFKKLVKEWLPHFHGDLPEDPGYYALKDLGLLGLYLLGTENPIGLGFFAYQLFSMATNTFSNKYEQDALCGAMFNMDYHSKRGREEGTKLEAKQAYQASLAKLRDLLDHKYAFIKGDSKPVQQAKKLSFQEHIQELLCEKKFQEILKETEPNFAADSCTITATAFEAFDQLNIIFVRYQLYLQICDKDKKYCIESYQDYSAEIAQMMGYCEKKFKAEKVEKGPAEERLKERKDEVFKALKARDLELKTLYLFHNQDREALIKATDIKWSSDCTGCHFADDAFTSTTRVAIEAFDLLKIVFIRYQVLLQRYNSDQTYCIGSYDTHSAEISQMMDYCEQKFKAVKLEDGHSEKELQTVKECVLNTLKINTLELQTHYFDHQEDHEALIQATAIEWSPDFTSCYYQGNSIQLIEGFSPFLRRCRAFINKIKFLDESQGSSSKQLHSTIKTILQELQGVSRFLRDQQVNSPNRPEVLKQVEHLEKNLITDFVGCYSYCYIKSNNEDFKDPWELLLYLDLIVEEKRDIRYWYSLIMAVDDLKKSIESPDPRFFQFTAMQYGCFVKIMELTDRLKAENLSDFERSVAVHARQYLAANPKVMSSGYSSERLSSICLLQEAETIYQKKTTSEEDWKKETAGITRTEQSGDLEWLKRFVTMEHRTKALYQNQLRSAFTYGISPSDGDCFFYAVSKQLYSNAREEELSGHMHVLRNEIANFMASRSQEYQPQIDGSFEEHLRKLRVSANRNEGIWGEFIHVHVLHQISGRPVYIYCTDDPQLGLEQDAEGRPQPGKTYRFTGHGAPIYLLYNGINHWDYLLPRVSIYADNDPTTH